MTRRFCTACCAGFAVFFAIPAVSSEIVYRPLIPSFGGNPLNSSHFIGVANSVNDFEDPRRQAGATASDPEDQFVRQLQSRLYSGLASQVVAAIFGDDSAEQGEFVLGSQQISYFRTLESVSVTILDADTGETTEIVIPNLAGN